MSSFRRGCGLVTRAARLAPGVLFAATSLYQAGCTGEPRRFPLRAPIWVDDDLRPVSVPCRADPADPAQLLCRPADYESPFLWDVADNTVFRPITRSFEADYGVPSQNVNALDEVPDSSWFTNRIGLRAMSPDEVLAAGCGPTPIAPERSKPGSWVIDLGKPNGATPGFRISIEGVGRFMLKADVAGEGERATAATAIASRLYHAAGWNAPCDTVVHFDPALLSLSPGLRFADNSGVERDFDAAALERVLGSAERRDGKVRMVASPWLPGRTIGPFRYEGVRDDDPNDVVPHENRRDLRGARIIAAWLGHYDAREQNSMTTWVSLDPNRKDASPGYTLHHYIDLADCFGSKWEWDAITRRLNHAYYLDLGQIAVDTLSFGLLERPWDRARIQPGLEMFNYFSADFEPDAWKAGYPNPAFARMQEADGAWAARILSRFDQDHLAAAIRAGDLSDERHRVFLLHALSKRLHAIRRRYFAELSPIADIVVEGDRVCAVDLARQAKTWSPAEFHYASALWAGAELAPVASPPVEVAVDGRVCARLPRTAGDARLADDDARRYVVLDLYNGVAPGPLRAHLYDLGAARGHRLVGIERPKSGARP
jgi:hypothetical protein